MDKRKNIGELLLQYGMISKDDIEEGLKYKKGTDLRLGEALVELGKVTMEDIDWILSKQLDIPFVIVEDIIPNVELLQNFRKKFLIENRMLPLYETDDLISIVIEDPFNKPAIDYVKDSFGKEVSLATGSGSKIEAILKQTFNKIGLPDLVNSINKIIEKIRETSFYRIDFFLDEYLCTINVFGCGIMKNIGTVKGHFSNDDVFRAFDDIGLPFLYEQSFSNNNKFIAIYPLENEIYLEKLPAIIGAYGLYLPVTTTFTDIHVYGVHHIFPLKTPMLGYNCLLTQRNAIEFEKSIYTVDSAPKKYEDYYVKLYAPAKCTSCDGAGCQLCDDLGYVFTKIEGVYSSDDLNKLIED